MTVREPRWRWGLRKYLLPHIHLTLRSALGALAVYDASRRAFK